MAGTNIYGELIRAQLQNAAADVASSTGMVYFNTVSAFPKYYSGAAWKTLADLDSTQTFTGVKTLASAIGTTAFTLNAQGELRFADSDSSNYVGFKSPATVAANKIWTLPDTDGTVGQYLKTDGSLVLGWASALSDPMTTRGDIIYRNSSNATARLAIGTASKVLTSDGTDLSYQFGGYNVAAKSANYTITDSDGFSEILVTTSTSTITITMPAAANNTNRKLFIKKVDGSTGKVTISSGNNMDGVGSIALVDRYDGVTMVSDGSQWYILGFVCDASASSSAADTGNGFGSTATDIRRFTNKVETGNAITVDHNNSTTGAIWTINQDGIYAIEYTDRNTGGAANMGVSLNTSQTTTSVASITLADRILFVTSPSANLNGTVSGTFRFSSGDLIRAHGDASQNDTTNRSVMRVRKIGLSQ